MKSEDITGGLDLLGDWLDAKGYTEEAGLCTQAMDEINRLREALKPFADLGMRQAPGSDGDTFIVNIPSAAAIRAARAAMGESDE